MDYDTSVIPSREIALELQASGFSAESAVQIRVDGVRCESCVRSIEGRLGELSGVSHVQVSLQDASALIQFQPFVVTPQQLREQIEDAGFDAALFPEDPPGQEVSCWQSSATQTATVWIVGMTCSSCVQAIEGRVSQVTGVHSVAVSLADGKGTMTFDPGVTEPEKLRVTIEDMGFDASLDGRNR